MAKVKDKSALGVINKVLFIIFIVLLIATIGIVIFSAPKVAKEESEEEFIDVSVIDPAFKAGNYGGIEFSSDEDVVNYYVECYNKTKAQTSQYKTEDGSTATYYTMLGEDSLNIEDLLIDGKENGTISNLVPGIVGGLFSNGLNGLPPSNNRDPNLDVDLNGENFMTSRLVADDVIATGVVDNGDGTITLTIQPKLTSLSTPGMDPQGHFFTTLGDISGVVDSISVLSWASGDTASNIICNYMGGTGVIKIDTATGLIVEADYYEVAKIAVKHANVAVIKDKSASLTIKYDMHYPASDEYMMNTKGCSRIG